MGTAPTGRGRAPAYIASSAQAQIFAVAGVTVANGGDDLGVGVPLFARETADVSVDAAVFVVMTAVWCAAGHRCARCRPVGERIRRCGHVVVIALGIEILADARVLPR